MKRFLNSENIFCFIAILFSVLITNNTLLFGTNANDTFNQFATYLSCILSAVLTGWVFLRKKQFDLKSLIPTVVSALLILLSMLANQDLRMGYIFRIALLFFAWSLAEKIPFRKFARAYDWVMTVLAATSLVAIGLYVAVPGIFNGLPIFENSAGLRIFHFGITTVPDFYAGFPRNFGIFREPGVYQMYLIIAMLFQIACFKKTNSWKLALYAVTVLTTLSTVGVLALGLIFLLFLVRIFTHFSKRTKITLISVGGILTVGVLLIPGVTETFYDLLISKWNIHGASGASSIARYASILVNLLLALKSPIFGVGITQTNTLFPQLCMDIFGASSDNNTNTLLINFAIHGCIFGILFLIGYLKGALALGKSPVEKMLIILIVLVLFMSQNYSYSLIAYLLLFYGFSASFPKKINNPLFLLKNKFKKGSRL